MRKIILLLLFLCVLCSAASATLGEDWVSISAPAERGWLDVAYGNGYIVAISSDGDGNDSIMRSNDGVHFDLLPSVNDSKTWDGITWDEDGEQFIVVGDNAIMTSPDGETWTERDSPTDSYWTSVASGDGHIMAVASSGSNRVIRSNDSGVTWNVYSVGDFDSHSWTCVDYGNGSFIMASPDGSIGELLTSTTSFLGGTTSTSSFVYEDIVFGNNTWVIISSGGDYRPTYKTSVRNTTGGWNQATSSYSYMWSAVAYGDGIFVSTASGDAVMTSTDGTTWELGTPSDSEYWTGLTYCDNGAGDTMFVATSTGLTSNDIMTSGNIAPYLVSPANNTIYNESYPPLLHDIPLVWSSVNTSGYKYQVARDINYNSIVIDSSTTKTLANAPLQDGTYYWRVAAYSDDIGGYMDYSDSWTFTINATTTSTGTGVDGTVYSSGGSLLSGARVTIYNDTYTNDYLTTSNGYFLFNDGIDPGSYVIQASKDGYETNSLNAVNVTSGETITKNIILEEDNAPNYILPHYVEFIVKSINEKYEGVTVTIYEGDSATALYTLTTGSDGAAGAELSQNIEYRVKFYKDGIIDRTTYVYPTDTEYTAYVDIDNILDDLFGQDDEEQEITAIEIDINKYITSESNANIEVSYNDLMDETSGLTFTLSQNIQGDATNTTVLDSVSLGTVNSTTHNFTVSNYNGESYFISIEATHGTHGDVDRLYGVQFENTESRFGFAVEIVGWLAIFGVVWFASTASQATVPQTAIGACALATILKMLGWGYYISWDGILLSWFVSLAANFVKAKES